MALSANVTNARISQDDRSNRATPEVKNTSVLYKMALCSADTDTGACKPFDGTESDALIGWHWDDTTTGDTSASPKPRAKIITGPFLWHRLTVANLAGTVADNMKPVWATDDGTYTVQDPGGSGALVGRVMNYVSSSVADVMMNNVFGHIDTLSPLPTPTPSPTPTPTPTPT
jgi:hypothetical protein